MQNANNKKIIKYPLAKPGRRIISKAIDILIISCLVMAAGFAIFCTDPNFDWNKKLEIQNWRYGVFVTIMLVIFFIWMLIIPIFSKQTIGMKILKLYYHKKESSNYFFSLFKHELFIWEILVIIAFVMGWILSALNQNQIDSMLQGTNSIFVNQVPDGLDAMWFYVGTTFSCLYGILITFLVAIIIAICIRNGRQAFHDKYSNLYIFWKKAANETKKIKIENKETKVPGAISIDSLEELENI